MIERFCYGENIDTGAVEKKIEKAPSGSVMQFGDVTSRWPFNWKYKMDKDDMVFGLGQSMMGMNKRGNLFINYCTDVARQDESAKSMYGAHNFLLLYNASKYNSICFGLFFDTASKIRFDIGNTDSSLLQITTEDTGVDVYVITPAPDRIESSLCNVVRQFRNLIGQSYIPPRWAFGFQQSRYGYKTQEDIENVVNGYKKNNLPLDAVCLDIDYMQDYKDFTVNSERFPDMALFVQKMKDEGIHLIPIIDAGIKAQDGFELWDEGKEKGFFCTKEDGSIFTAGVWPGESAFPDFLNPEARRWFGSHYKKLTDLGIDGFWNDMNEPSIFYTKDSIKEAFDKFRYYETQELNETTFFEFKNVSQSLECRQKDFESFYHNVTLPETDNASKTKRYPNSKVHNIYGAGMTQAAFEGLEQICPEKRILLYTRSSAIGSHRYGGIWTGDNDSSWAHLEQEIKMLPGLNMAGFLYSGADIGGFDKDTTRELLLRWLALGVFVPLMRNHSMKGTRNQECYAFGDTAAFKSILDLRYTLLPYIYSEFVKAAVSGSMFIRPIGFDYPEDAHALATEDQLLVGEGIMIVPIYKQNISGRYVYLPEEMTKVTWCSGKVSTEVKNKGSYYITMAEDTVVFFIKKDCAVPLAKNAKNADCVKTDNLVLIGSGESYRLYEDDGLSRAVTLEGHIRTIKKS